jgi:hypothetical protein
MMIPTLKFCHDAGFFKLWRANFESESRRRTESDGATRETKKAFPTIAVENAKKQEKTTLKPG